MVQLWLKNTFLAREMPTHDHRRWGEQETKINHDECDGLFDLALFQAIRYSIELICVIQFSSLNCCELCDVCSRCCCCCRRRSHVSVLRQQQCGDRFCTLTTTLIHSLKLTITHSNLKIGQQNNSDLSINLVCVCDEIQSLFHTLCFIFRFQSCAFLLGLLTALAMAFGGFDHLLNFFFCRSPGHFCELPETRYEFDWTGFLLLWWNE